MAKKNGMLWKIGLTLAGVLITIGIYIATVRSNTGRIDKVEVKAHENEGDIRDIKKDITYIREGIDEIKQELKK